MRPIDASHLCVEINLIHDLNRDKVLEAIDREPTVELEKHGHWKSNVTPKAVLPW